MKEKVIELIKIAIECGYNLRHEVNIDDNIIIPATSEEKHYYVLFNYTWYEINLKTNEFSQNDFGGEYYEDWYLN
jgi:elongation factor P hydroxylase